MAPYSLVGCVRLPLPVNKQGAKVAATQTVQYPFQLQLHLAQFRLVTRHLNTAFDSAHALHCTILTEINTRKIEEEDKNTMNNDHQASTNYREAFQLFDKRGNGRVDRGALGDLLRACGQNPTLAEITDLERGVGADCTFSLTP